MDARKRESLIELMGYLVCAQFDVARKLAELHFHDNESDMQVKAPISDPKKLRESLESQLDGFLFKIKDLILKNHALFFQKGEPVQTHVFKIPDPGLYLSYEDWWKSVVEQIRKIQERLNIAETMALLEEEGKHEPDSKHKKMKQLSKKSNKDPILTTATAYITVQKHPSWTMERIADAVGVSRQHLYKIPGFKEARRIAQGRLQEEYGKRFFKPYEEQSHDS